MEQKTTTALDRLTNAVRNASMLTLRETADNGDWQWVDVELDMLDETAAAESAQALAEMAGFKFSSLDWHEGSIVLRFNHSEVF